MYNGKTILCIIPARGGSKGLPGKNIKELCGKPLIAYSIEQAIASKYIDRVIVSTEDDSIADVARRYKAEVPFKRPPELATDTCGVIDVLIHALDWMRDNQDFDPDALVLLHATTPLRTTEDIDNCIELLYGHDCDNVFSVAPSYRNPYFNMVELDKNGSVRLVKTGGYLTRQSAPDVYDMNASIYVWRTAVLREQKGLFLKNTKIYVMPKERSVDIDEELDFRIVEMLMRDKIA